MKKPRAEAAETGDIRALHELEKRNFIPEDVFSPARLRSLLRSPTCRILVIRGDGGLLAGLIVLFRRNRVPTGRIYKIVVDASARGQGLASLLLDAADEMCRDMGIKRVCAEVRQSNVGSIRLFEKHGYEPTKILKAYYPDGEDGIKFWMEEPVSRR